MSAPASQMLSATSPRMPTSLMAALKAPVRVSRSVSSRPSPAWLRPVYTVSPSTTRSESGWKSTASSYTVPKSNTRVALSLLARSWSSSKSQNSRNSVRDRSTPVVESDWVMDRQRGRGTRTSRRGSTHRGLNETGSGSPPSVSGWSESQRTVSAVSPAPWSRIDGSMSRARNWTAVFCAAAMRFCHTSDTASAESNPTSGSIPVPSSPRAEDGRLPYSQTFSLSGRNIPPSASKVST